MAQSFAVTTTSNQVSLDKDGKGEAIFTVTNSSARDLEGRATVASKDAAQAPWLTIVGEATRKFSPSATEQYAVQVVVPPGTEAATLTFGLKVVALDRPDEDFTEGPMVSATYTPPAPEPKKKFPRWIAIIVAIVLIGGGVTFALVPREVDVPDVVGDAINGAKQRLDARGLKSEIAYRTTFDAPEGQVLSQVPPAGTSVSKGKTVELRVAKFPEPETQTLTLSQSAYLDLDASTAAAIRNLTATSRRSDDIRVEYGYSGLGLWTGVERTGAPKLIPASSSSALDCYRDLLASQGGALEMLINDPEDEQLCIQTEQLNVALVKFIRVEFPAEIEVIVWRMPQRVVRSGPGN